MNNPMANHQAVKLRMQTVIVVAMLSLASLGRAQEPPKETGTFRKPDLVELSKLDRRAFAHGAYVRSWGCHTGESMSKKWYRATGTHMIGAIGKTQFMMEELPILTSTDGKWVN